MTTDHPAGGRVDTGSGSNGRFPDDGPAGRFPDRGSDGFPGSGFPGGFPDRRRPGRHVAGRGVPAPGAGPAGVPLRAAAGTGADAGADAGADGRSGVGPEPGRGRGRRAVAVVCAVLGSGLVGGAAAGTWLLGRADAAPPAAAYGRAASMWRAEPVDTLFPPVLVGDGAGPGGADRRWTRVAVDPGTGCHAWAVALGCAHEVRATYTDATRSAVVGAGLVFTVAPAPAQAALKTRLGGRPPLPTAYGIPDRARASWTVSVLTDAPAVVYAVSGFADRRPVAAPRPAAAAMASDDRSAVAQAGLGHEARAVADRLERGLRRRVAASGPAVRGAGR
ncbi:hypothetical protein [Streptomyces sp. NPDC093225]|uniref:hypothetical protein n=1 Tax=Streptomyces sp. NPDC093225 TaxID=3366034 RepID=UPI00382B46EA